MGVVWCDHELINDTAAELLDEARAHAIDHHVQDHEAFNSVEYGLMARSMMREIE
jgi:hypothetical protein